MGTPTMVLRVASLIGVIVGVSLAAPNPSNPQLPYRCEKPSPSFCTNVDWMVSNNSLSENSQNMAEVVLEIAYYSQPGTDDCKKQYKDIECRRRFPYCDGGPGDKKVDECKKVGECVPCKSECENFVDKCPGSPLDCGVYPEKTECYKFSVASSASLTSTVSMTLVAVLSAAALLFSH